MEIERPNPDELLAKIKAEEKKSGKLKIFFGAIAGVGKTYRMLESARLRKKEGIDIVVGYVETHKRAETEVLLDGLEILPPKLIPYKNIQLREFDIDAALKRNPKIILVDEMAHTNTPQSRHLKRWQDIEELLSKGIDVYTTLNVQHCESANDVVAQITGVVVRETIPDTIVEKADEIELVDLPTEELLKRLKEGKVYLGEQKERASQHFFRPGNLIALRQLAFRYIAHNVDAKMLSYKQAHAVSNVWEARDRFLVGISSSPNAVHLIRAVKRIASDLGVEWIVAYVENFRPLKQVDKDRVAEMLHFAEKLGADTITLTGADISDTLIQYARSKNVTKIIVGKPEKRGLSEIIFGSVIDKIAHKCGEIDLYLLSGETKGEETFKLSHAVLVPFLWKNLFHIALIVILCTLVNRLLFPHISVINTIMIYLLTVTWVAFRYGRWMSIIASLLSVLFFDFFFVPPFYTFAVADVQYIITFAIMLFVGVSIANLTGLLKRQTIVMRLQEERTQSLYALTRDLSKSSYPDELFKIALGYIQEFFKCNVVIFAPDANNRLLLRFGQTKELNITSNEYAVAQWVYENKKAAGKGMDTLAGSLGIYLPFNGLEKTVGVVGVFPKEDKQFVDPEQLHMLEMFVKQTAFSVERANLAAAELDAESRIENERLRDLLLKTLTYDLGESLTAISEAAKELLNPENINNEAKRASIIQKICKEADSLNKLNKDK
ncbi:MAG: sensor histidine kinase KdpD [Candidatus Atribacteria bacterium]|nr:sensor histidine kinase KdpD [Candidatus Atribacteria bacterium]